MLNTDVNAIGRIFRSLLVVIVTLGVAAGLAGTAAAAVSPVASQSLDFLTWKVAEYAGPLGGYRDGIWQTTNTICWSCNQGGPSSAAATAYMLLGKTQPALLQDAEGAIDHEIATRQQRNGSFLPPADDTQPIDIATMFFAVEEGNTYLELESVLDPARRARWRASIAAAAQYLAHAELGWYTNGNIELGNTELFYLAWRATGDPKFDWDYNLSLDFTLHPPQNTWRGRGLIIVKQPTRADGSDGEGYLTETGSGGTGFDPEYTELQVEVASRLYLLSGDPRVLRLDNLLVNMLLTRVNTSEMVLNASHGTRHTQADRWVPLNTPGFAVLGLDGGRSDLVKYILPELQEAESYYAQSWTDNCEVYRRGLGNDISVIALAANLAHPVGWAAGSLPDLALASSAAGMADQAAAARRSKRSRTRQQFRSSVSPT